MTESKTAKKIEVVPCQTVKHAQHFHILIGDRTYHADGMNPWCGTEAEAQAKARELREWEEKEAYAEESKHQKYDQRIAEFAAAQPTETRPPRWAWDAAEAVFSSAIKWNEGEKPWDMEYMAWTIVRHHARAAATALVEPAPRPHPDSLKRKDGQYVEYHAAAASSPVAPRTLSEALNRGCTPEPAARPRDPEREAAVDNLLDEIAARLEQPTLAVFIEQTAKELASRTNLLDHAFSEMREIAEKELYASTRTIDSLDSEEISNQRPSPDSGTDRPSTTLHSKSQHLTAPAAPVVEQREKCQHNNLRLIRKSVDGHRLDLYHCNDCQRIVDVERLTEKTWEHDEGCRDGNCEHPDRIEEANKAERALLQEMDGVSEWEAVKLLRDYISDLAASQRTEGEGQYGKS